jgi:hypothetical protein
MSGVLVLWKLASASGLGGATVLDGPSMPRAGYAARSLGPIVAGTVVDPIHSHRHRGNAVAQCGDESLADCADLG